MRLGLRKGFMLNKLGGGGGGVGNRIDPYAINRNCFGDLYLWCGRAVLRG